MASLVDQFCPNVHDAPITAAARDPSSGVCATADARGVVAITRAGESTPGRVIRVGEAAVRALALVRGGSLVACGDDNGTVGVYTTDRGEATFLEAREGARGKVRAMKGIALSPEGSRLAAIAADGLLRIWSVERGQRETAWQGFGGSAVHFDERGTRVLCVDDQGQPRLVDLVANQGVSMDRIQMPAEQAIFSADGTLIVTAGPAGIALLRVVDGQLLGSFATRGGSGILNLVMSPDGARVGAVTQRSVHVFSLPELQPVESVKHGAVGTTGAAWWGPKGIRVGGQDGLMHGSTQQGGAGPVTAVGGFGPVRVSVHGDRMGVWKANRWVTWLAAAQQVREAHVDRDGRYLVALPEKGALIVYDLARGERLFDGGLETADARGIGVGGDVVACHLAQGGVRWWDVARNQALELKWAQGMALSHGGTWLAVITPRGAVKVLDPGTGKEVVPDPAPSADVPARLLSFVNRRPDLLVVDQENILCHHDLAAAVREGVPSQGRDVIQFATAPDHVWGITGGQYAAVRLPEGDRASILFVDIHRQAVTAEVAGLHPRAWVDAEEGLILEPARGAALLEREMDGTERRVLRALPDEQWVAFGRLGILDVSAGAGISLGQ